MSDFAWKPARLERAVRGDRTCWDGLELPSLVGAVARDVLKPPGITPARTRR